MKNVRIIDTGNLYTCMLEQTEVGLFVISILVFLRGWSIQKAVFSSILIKGKATQRCWLLAVAKKNI